MKNLVKRILCAVVVLCLCLSVLPTVSFDTEAASTGLTLGQLREKFPHGKYWNHANNPGSSNSANNQNGYTSTPCTKHGGYIGTSQQTCNGFEPDGSQLSWQCMGYAEKLGYDATGYNPRNNAHGWYTYTSSSALNNLKAGDIVRYKNNGHSIYVTAVNGDTVTYTDCNGGGNGCMIRWDQTISKATLKSTFTHVRSAPSSVTPGPAPSCNCSTSYAGEYVCTTSSLPLTIRSGHGSSYGSKGSIPSGATVSVSKADGSWAHVTYNGVSGYASMSYLQKKDAHTHSFYYAYSAEHPHNQYKHCAGCGHFELTGATRTDSSCSICNPPSHAETPTIQWWLSDSEYGDSVGEYKTGNRYYYNFRLYDSMSGRDWDDVSDNSYSVKIAVYNPDGSLNYSHSTTSDRGWLSIYYKTSGTYTMRVEIDGDFLFTGERKFTVKDNPLKVNTSSSTVNLVIGQKEAYSIQVWSTGYYNGNYSFYWSRSNTNIGCSWGSWDNGKCPLTFTANNAGSTTVTVSVKDRNTGALIDSVQVTVNVTASSYNVSYNANGGTGAPAAQTKQSGTSLTLSKTIPTRKGYTFLGWSASSGAATATYKPGSIYSADSSVTLYAVWKRATSLSLNSQFTAPITYGGQEYLYSFTPSSSGKYIIYSSGSEDTRVYFYKSSGELIGSDDDGGESYNFRLECNLIGGNTYYFGVKYYSSSRTGNITARLEADSITVSYNANGGTGAPAAQTKQSGKSLTLSKTVPTRKGYTFLGWSASSGASTATYMPGSIYSSDSSVTLYAVWKKASSLIVGSQFTTTITYGGQEYLYSFTPSSSGKYVIYSSGSEDTRVYLYNASGTYIASNDDGGEGWNFRLEYSLTAGTTYYFGVKYYSSSRTGTINARFEKALTLTGLGSLTPVGGNNLITVGGQQNGSSVQIESTPGDIDADGVVSAIDLAKVCRKLMNNSGDCDNAGADVNEDGKLSIIDLIRMKKLIADL